MNKTEVFYAGVVSSLEKEAASRALKELRKKMPGVFPKGKAAMKNRYRGARESFHYGKAGSRTKSERRLFDAAYGKMGDRDPMNKLRERMRVQPARGEYKEIGRYGPVMRSRQREMFIHGARKRLGNKRFASEKLKKEIAFQKSRGG